MCDNAVATRFLSIPTSKRFQKASHLLALRTLWFSKLLSLALAAASAKQSSPRGGESLTESPRLTDIDSVDHAESVDGARALGHDVSAESSPGAGSSPVDATKKLKRNRCFTCKKKVGLTGGQPFRMLLRAFPDC